MSFRVIPGNLVYGAADPLPAKGWPTEPKFIVSPHDFAFGVVRSDESERAFLVISLDGYWTPGPEVELDRNKHGEEAAE